MRIRTIDGPPLPNEIAEMTARAIALIELIDKQNMTVTDHTADDWARPSR
ncbi:hypothetical protein HQO83_06840 [Rhodococcus fascians]|nr:hypothetical protein [Rhodococcus fascians]